MSSLYRAVFGFREFCSDLPASTSRISPMNPAKLGPPVIFILFTAFAFGQLTERNPVDELMEQARSYVCRKCYSPVPQGHKFCGRCGIPLGAAALNWHSPRPVEILCKLCGTSYPAGTRFCGRCGKPINP